MRLTQPFLKLPISFCAETLAAEVNALPESAWVLHPNKFPGNEAVRLITPGGAQTDKFNGPMRPTEFLECCPYIAEVMGALGGVWGRSRLMGLAPGADVTPHVDAHYHWHTHMRIHVPVLTNPGVEFVCGDETVHMAAGDCWTFDSFRWHEVHNRGSERRVHLVLDTKLTGRLWDLIDGAQTGTPTPTELQPGRGKGEPLLFEQFYVPRVMSAWEIRCHTTFVAGHALPHPQLETVLKRLDRFADCWAALWAQLGTSETTFPAYRRLAHETRIELRALGAAEILLRNQVDLGLVIDQLIFVNAVSAPAEQALGTMQQVAGQRRLAS
jgi:hypothetical protein